MKRIIMLFLIFSLIPFAKAEAISEKLTVDMHYIVVNPVEDSSIQIKHTVNFTNVGEEEFKGDPGAGKVLEIGLPPGAMELQVDDETLGAKPTESGFSTSKPFAPKESQSISYSYFMPAGVPVSLKLNYPLQVMQVLIPEGVGSLVIDGAKSTNAGLMQFEEKNFWLYNVEGVESDKDVKITYDKSTQPTPAETPEEAQPEGEGTPEAAGESAGNVTRTSPDFHNPGHVRLWYQSPLKKFNPHILLIVLGAILVAGLGYYSFFKWKYKVQEQKIGADKEEQLFKQLLARQNAIMDKIIELEDLYAQGVVSEEEYLAKLAAFKQHLVKVKLALRQFIE